MHDDWIETLARGHFEIDVPEIRIAGGGWPEPLAGSGTIIWDWHDSLFRFRGATQGFDPWKEMQRGLSTKPGTLLPESDAIKVTGKAQRWRIEAPPTHVGGVQTHGDSPYAVWDLPIHGLALRRGETEGKHGMRVRAVLHARLPGWTRHSIYRDDNPLMGIERRTLDWLGVELETGTLRGRPSSRSPRNIRIPRGSSVRRRNSWSGQKTVSRNLQS